MKNCSCQNNTCKIQNSGMSWYSRVRLSNKEIKIASFDFDGTIFLNKWIEENHDYERDNDGKIIGQINNNILVKMEQFRNAGWEIYIITSRLEKNSKDVYDIIKEYNLNYIHHIFFTNMQSKSLFINQIHFDKLIHFDDDVEEISEINALNNPKIIAIKV